MNEGTYNSLYDKGIAVGHSDVTNDALVFRWRDELFTIPGRYLFGKEAVASHNGYFYEAKVSKLRKLTQLLKEHGDG